MKKNFLLESIINLQKTRQLVSNILFVGVKPTLMGNEQGSLFRGMDRRRYGFTDLMTAAALGGEQGEPLVRALLSTYEFSYRKQIVDAQNNDGMTALMFATDPPAWKNPIYGERVMHMLINEGEADVNSQDRKGWTALMYAALRDSKNAVAKMHILINNGADVNIKDYTGWTALMFAIQCDVRPHRSESGFVIRQGYENNIEMVPLLIAHGAISPPYNSTDMVFFRTQPDRIMEYVDGAQNWGPLHRAADARDFDTLFMLLREREPMHVYYSDTVVSTHKHMHNPLSIVSSDKYPCAAPLCQRCIKLMVRGPVWSVETHKMCSKDEKLAASARAIMMNGKRKRDDGTSYVIDIGPVRGADCEWECLVPRDIWSLIFSYLIFDGYTILNV